MKQTFGSRLLTASLQVKASRRDTTTMVDFNDDTGCMVPLIICKGHTNHRRELYEICDTNEFGEVSHFSPFISISTC